MNHLLAAEDGDTEKINGYWGAYLPEKEKGYYGYPGLRGYLFSLATGETAKDPHRANAHRQG